ncbi:hypothetical protein [Campylobacter sp.]|uniref:hypothetical protein n=1 Tax=Campylobacter sp. TaxID=205 RepID=UPI0025B7E30C|nr:hypothetical protein [Campylobacter sp.]
MSKPVFAEHKKRYERSEIYKTTFLLYLYALICYRYYPDTPPFFKISDVALIYARI